MQQFLTAVSASKLLHLNSQTMPESANAADAESAPDAGNEDSDSHQSKALLFLCYVVGAVISGKCSVVPRMNCPGIHFLTLFTFKDPWKVSSVILRNNRLSAKSRYE